MWVPLGNFGDFEKYFLMLFKWEDNGITFSIQQSSDKMMRSHTYLLDVNMVIQYLLQMGCLKASLMCIPRRVILCILHCLCKKMYLNDQILCNLNLTYDY